MTLNGWIAIPRSVMAADWYTRADAFTRALWLHLMLTANFTTTTTRTGLVLQPGQLVTSWATLAAALPSCDSGHPLNASRSKVRRAADYLRKAGEATYHPTGKPTHTGTVVTLERWALYAGEMAQPAQEPTQQPTGGVSAARPHRNNNTGPVGPNCERPLRAALADFERRERESMRELHDVRARERGYVQGHVGFVKKTFEQFTVQPRPRFRDAYNEVANAKSKETRMLSSESVERWSID